MRTLLSPVSAHRRSVVARIGAGFGIAALPAWASTAQAHTGHGLAGTSHWHADHALLYLALAAAGAAGWWLSRHK